MGGGPPWLPRSQTCPLHDLNLIPRTEHTDHRESLPHAVHVLALPRQGRIKGQKIPRHKDAEPNSREGCRASRPRQAETGAAAHRGFCPRRASPGPAPRGFQRTPTGQPAEDHHQNRPLLPPPCPGQCVAQWSCVHNPFTQ